jgi:hypothetical protein
MYHEKSGNPSHSVSLQMNRKTFAIFKSSICFAAQTMWTSAFVGFSALEKVARLNGI